MSFKRFTFSKEVIFDPPSREEIVQKTKDFVKKGGEVVTLPPEISLTRSMVMSEGKTVPYELVENISALSIWEEMNEIL